MRFSPRHVVRLLIIACVALLVVTVIVCWKPDLETWYIQRLEHDDWNERQGAALELGRLECARAVPALLELWVREFVAVSGAPGIRPAGRLFSRRQRLRELGQRGGADPGRAGDILTALARIGPHALPALVAALHDDERVDLRYAAVNVLARLGPGAAPALLPLTVALGDEEQRVRLAALTALEALGAPGRPSLLGALRSRDDLLVARALDRLVGRTKPSPEVLGAVEELMRSRGPETSREVFESVRDLYRRRQPPDAYAGYLRRAMAGGAGHVPHLAAEELGSRLGAAAIPELVDFGRAHEEDAYRAWRPFLSLCPDAEPLDWTPESLGERQPAVIDALRRALVARLVDARYAALHALGAFVPGSDEALRILHASLEDRYLRDAAIDVLVEVDPAASQNVAARLERAFEESDAGDFALAARTVPRLEPERGGVVPVLVGALALEDFAQAAARALEVISTTPGWEVAAPDLIEMLGSSRSLAAMTYLQAMGSRVIDSLTAVIDQPHRPTRLGVLRVLGDIGADSAPAVPALIELLDHADRPTRASVVRALGLIGIAARSAAARLERTKQSDPSHGVRLAAAVALDRIAAARAEEK